MNNDNQHQLESSKDVIVLEGFFFIKSPAFKNNSDIVNETFQDLFSNISYN